MLICLHVANMLQCSQGCYSSNEQFRKRCHSPEFKVSPICTLTGSMQSPTREIISHVTCDPAETLWGGFFMCLLAFVIVVCLCA